ncbi:MAG: YraN family protein [Planctomycetes bacterium]|nr:YraN family protein [Planctomycetota bacterium]
MARRRPTEADRAPTGSGSLGESFACRALLAAGYRVVASNLRTRAGEIDLLCRRRRTWIAVEVKARRDHPAPERCVTAEQLDRIERSLLSLAAGLRPRPRELRIDVVAVHWASTAPGAPPTPEKILHFRAVRRVVLPAHGRPRSKRALAARPSTPNQPSGITLPLPPSVTMATLTEQLIPRRKLLLIVSEGLLFTLVILVGSSVWPLTNRSFWLLAWSEDLWRGILTSVTIALICLAVMSYHDLYDWKTAQNRAQLANRLVRSCGYSLVMLALLPMVIPSLFYLPGFQNINTDTWKLIALVGVGFTLTYALRHAFHWFFYKWRFGERVVVLGSSQEALAVARMIRQNPMAGYELLGLVPEHDQPPLELGADDPQLLGSIEDLQQHCRDDGISRVVVALRERRGKVPVDALLRCRMDGVIVEEREAMYERLTGKLALESMRPSYLIYGRGFAKDPLTMALKRVLDILASAVGLVLSLPICLLTMLVVKLTSRGPVFFVQQRVGEDGEPFPLIKFRTMTVDAEKESGPVWAQKNDARITPIGKFLRLTRIDEIPQFVNILAGQMSFVGPRPERPHFVEQLKQQIPFYPLRHTVKPGLTGWAQVRHPYGASIDDAQEKLRYDLYYIKNMNLLFDVNIMLRTVGVILGGKGAR